jgi:hypothetical protein
LNFEVSRLTDDNLLLQKLETMNAHENISVGIDLEEISVERVKPETADREARIVLKEKNF